mgnify:FL=1
MKIGVDIGGSHVAIGKVNKDKIINKTEVEISSNIIEIEEFITKYIVNYIEEVKKKESVELIGIATPGNAKNGIIYEIVNLGIKEFNITKELQQYYNVPILVRNDAKCAAMAEKIYGSLKTYEDAVFLCLGTGIGAGVFLDNKLLVPKKNTGFEIGHMIIEKHGKQCNCGKYGCFETYCSIKRFKQNIREILKLEEEIEGKELLTIIEENEENTKVKKEINEYIQNLIIGLSNIIDLFEPQAIATGGGFVYYKNILYNKLLEEYYNKKYVFNKEFMPEIKLASLGNDAGIIGSVIDLK